MFDGVFDQRLQKHAGNHHLERSRVEFLYHLELVAPETHHLDIEVVIDKFHLLAQGNKGISTAQQAAEDGRQLDDQLTRRVRIKTHQRGNRIQGIKQKVRIDLVLQRFHARVQQQALLLFQLDLDAHAVPDLQLRPNHHDGGGVNQHHHPPGLAVQAETGAVEKARQLGLHQAQANDGDKEHDLPVEQFRRRQVAADHAIKALIDKRRERPDVVL